MAVQHAQLLANVACLVFCACATVSVTSVAGAPVTMTTSLGNVTGKMVPGGTDEADVNVFYGIPFAKPPVGELRFKPPVCPEKWSGSRQATTLPNSCWQALDTAFNRFPGVEMWNPNTPRNEDCLYLNTWVPATSTKKAIMVWIFGGGFWAGTTTLAVYDAIKLAARNDVIVVSIAYRLGVFGYMYTGDGTVPGNMGMIDQVAALHWVKSNAENMGGDPDKITLFGESAGAASVGYHLLSPLSKDLFNNGIMLSSSAIVNWGVQSHKTAVTRVKTLAKSVGCTDKEGSALVECLQQVDASTLADSQWNVVSGAYFDAPFALVVDGDFLLDHPNKLVNKGLIKEADIIAGVVKNEGIYWLLYGFPDVFGLRPDNPVNRTQFLSVVDGILTQYFMAAEETRRFGIDEHGQDIDVDDDDDDDDDDDEDDVERKRNIKEIIKKLAVVEYYDGVSPLHRMDYLHALDAMSGDVLFKCPVRDYCADHRSHKKGNVFMYSFEHRVSTNPWPSWLGVAHGYEIEVVMGLPFLHPGNYTDEERELSDRTMQYFSNFAKFGNPNNQTQSANSDKDWPAFDLRSEYYRILDLKESNSDGLRFGPCTFWSEDVPTIQRKPKSPEEQQMGDPDSASLLSDVTLPCLLVGLMTALWNLRL